MIQMGTLKTSKGHALSTLGSKNIKSKGKIKVMEQKKNSDSEDEGSNSIDECSDFKNKGNTKGISQCTYCRKYSHNENSCSKNKMNIII